LRRNDREELRETIVEIVRFPGADQVAQPLLALRPERECLLDGPLAGLREEHDAGARVRWIARHPQ